MKQINKNNILLSIDNGFSSRYFLRSDFIKDLLDSVDNIFVAVPNPIEFTKEGFEFDEKINFIQQPELKNTNSRKEKLFRHVNLIQKFGLPRDTKYSAIWVQRQIFKKDSKYSPFKKRLIGFAVEIHRNFYLFRLFLKWLVYFLKRDDRFEILLKEKNINKVVLDGLSTLIPRNIYWITASKKLNIESYTIITNWDHPTSRGHMAIGSDRYLVWGSSMKKELIKYQDIAPKKITEVGSVIFDMYANPSFIIPFEQINSLAENKVSKQYILFITNSPYYPFNLDIIKYLRNHIPPEITLVIRLHPLYLDDIAKDEFAQHKSFSKEETNIIYFFPKSSSQGFSADMSFSEMQLSASLVANCTLMINLFSTMVLDGLINNKHIINIAFDWEKHSPIPLMMSKAEFFIHINRIKKAHWLFNVKNKKELSSAIINILREGQNNLTSFDNSTYILDECGTIDGFSTKHIAEAISKY